MKYINKYLIIIACILILLLVVETCLTFLHKTEKNIEVYVFISKFLATYLGLTLGKVIVDLNDKRNE